MKRIDRCPACGQRKRRSNEANARYWVLLHVIAEKLTPENVRYSADVWHCYFKSRFLGCIDITLPNGKTLPQPNSTASLDVAAFADYMTKVEAWAHEHDCWLEDSAWAA